MGIDEERYLPNTGKNISHSGQTTPKVITRLPKIVFWVAFAAILSLLLIALITFVLVIQHQNEIARNTNVAEQHSETKWGDLHEQLAKAIVEEKFKKIVQDVLDNQTSTIKRTIESQIPLSDYQELQERMISYLSNLTSSMIQKLQEELGISNRIVERQVVHFLENLSGKVLKQLKDELEIDQAHIDMAVHRAVKNSSETSLALIRGTCEFLFDGKCYFLLKTGPISYSRANYYCTRQRGKAANIYDPKHYEASMNFLRKEMLPMDSVWLGMYRDFSIDRNYLEDGTESTFTIPWAAGYPKSLPLDTRLALRLTRNITSTEQGFFNILASSLQLGILCEL